MLEFWFAPENGSHYMGDPPYTPYHPLGEPASFCIEFEARPTASPVGEEPTRNAMVVASPELRSAVRTRVEEAFTLRHTERCVGTQGYRDEDGAPATQIRISTFGVGEGSVGVGLEFHAGLWPGLFGWSCRVHRPDGEGWQVDRTSCSYFEG